MGVGLGLGVWVKVGERVSEGVAEISLTGDGENVGVGVGVMVAKLTGDTLGEGVGVQVLGTYGVGKGSDSDWQAVINRIKIPIRQNHPLMSLILRATTPPTN
jgi:hypothetical protein